MDCTRLVCCRKCRPRYKRLVDNIYPTNPSEGLLHNNMQKLTFYAISHPEKLDRIGEYLNYRVGRDVYRERIMNVKITIEAMDRLLTASHGSPGLNLFVESFLKIVQKLLETPNPELQILATQSFVNFCNIEEDTPSYHRKYEFFISKFSAMCHNNHSNTYLKRKLRVSGLKGLRGVVRKTVSDDLQANIWEQSHMDKIVPSLLFNMHDNFEVEEEVDTDNVEEIPKLLADSCLRELTGKASYGNLKFVLNPLLHHFDHHKLWSPSAFAVSCFKAIMYSIQSQYSYVVIQTLMGHLDSHSSQADAKIRIGMATVLSEIVLIAATASIGPGLLEIFNSMLRHLRSSVEHQHTDRCRSLEDEKKYQETLINTMGDFANNLPDYQKVEILLFIIGKVPILQHDDRRRQSDGILQLLLVRTLLKVATKYKTGHLQAVLTTTFLEPLLRLSLVEDPTVRLLTQQIIHTLLDRHENLSLLEHLSGEFDSSDSRLQVEKCSRSDAMFMKKNGPTITSALFKSLQRGNNDIKNLDAVLCTMALLIVEISNEETVVELYRLCLGIQTMASDGAPDGSSPAYKVGLHNLVAKYMNFSSQLIAIPALIQHIRMVIKSRKDALPALDIVGTPNGTVDDDFVLTDELLFDKAIIAEALQSSGHEVFRLNMPFVPRPTSDSITAAKKDGDVDPSNVSLDIDSLDSGTGIGGYYPLIPANRRMTLVPVILNSRSRGGGVTGPGGEPLTQQQPLPLNFAMLKEIASQPPEAFRREEEARARRIADLYRTLLFEELLAMNKEYAVDMPDAVDRILARVKARELEQAGTGPGGTPCKPKTIQEIEFPDLFVY